MKVREHAAEAARARLDGRPRNGRIGVNHRQRRAFRQPDAALHRGQIAAHVFQHHKAAAVGTEAELVVAQQRRYGAGTRRALAAARQAARPECDSGEHKRFRFLIVRIEVIGHQHQRINARSGHRLQFLSLLA